MTKTEEVKDHQISAADVILAAAKQSGQVLNRAGYLSKWRSDVEGFPPRGLVEACRRHL